MRIKFAERILIWWVGSFLPREHYFWLRLADYSSWRSRVRFLAVQLLVHPIKRRLARGYLRFLRRFSSLRVIAITGSVGKTTTKDMIASVLSQKYRVVASKDNIDPLYNIPATILRCSRATEFLVLEMGVEYPGEMSFYLWLASPDIGVLTSLGLTHTEFFGDLEGVVREKTLLLEAVGEEGWVFLNIDDDRVRAQVRRVGRAQKKAYGTRGGSDIRAFDISVGKDFTTHFRVRVDKEPPESYRIPFLGKSFVLNALPAVGLASLFGVGKELVRKGLLEVSRAPHRLAPIRLASGALLIDDTYNSSPLALRSALEVLESLAPEEERVLVVGEMKELGRFRDRAHRDVGLLAARKGLGKLIGFGEGVEPLLEGALEAGLPLAKVVRCDSPEEVAAALEGSLGPGRVILIKGSRALKMERIVEKLCRKEAGES